MESREEQARRVWDLAMAHFPRLGPGEAPRVTCACGKSCAADDECSLIVWWGTHLATVYVGPSGG